MLVYIFLKYEQRINYYIYKAIIYIKKTLFIKYTNIYNSYFIYKKAGICLKE